MICECNIKYVPCRNKSRYGKSIKTNILNAYKSLRKIEKVYVHFQEDNS
jgi:hypothetical protein